jgi:similar to spore coat protein
MGDKKLLPYDGLQLHKILDLKNVELTKSVTMLPLISDNKLKDIVKQHINYNEEQINELHNLIEKSYYA